MRRSLVGLIVLLCGLLIPAAGAAAPTLAVAPASTVIGVGGFELMHAELFPAGPNPADWAFPNAPQFHQEDVVWVSSDPNVAPVVTTSGTVYGRAAGTATITATLGSLTASSTVTVTGAAVNNVVMTSVGPRPYLLYVPPGYTAGTAMPLVINIHGAGANDYLQEQTSQLNRLALQKGFIIAYPMAFESQWNAGGCCYGAQEFGAGTSAAPVDDVAYISTLIDTLEGAYTIDRHRVFATGISNGGLMAMRLGCQLSDKIAAVASVAGGLQLGGDLTSCAPGRHVSVMEIHGTTDSDIPYNGGAGAFGHVFQSVADTRNTWLAVDGIPASSATTVLTSGIATCTAYTASSDEVRICMVAPPALLTDPVTAAGEGLGRGSYPPVTSARYDGGGHAWPGGERFALYADWPTRDLDANSVIWDFFVAHPH
ncbi:MAG: alpha/beta hydrolase-fold protein [Actinomycetota bacterium]|nr:alpha/beta hydrolase-fold protein [Actinomycetota bacterium]